MNLRKAIIIGGSILAGVLIVAGTTMVINDNAKEKKAKADTIKVANKYLASVESKEVEKAYELVAKSSKEWLSQEAFSKYIDIYTMEDKVSFEIDESRQEAVTEEVNKYLDMIYKYAEKTKDERLVKMKKNISSKQLTYVPVKRSYMTTVNGKKKSVSDELILGLVPGDTGYKIYFEIQSFERERVKLYFKKAYEYTTTAMENMSDEDIVKANKSVITKCINYASLIKPEYYYSNRVNVYVEIFKSYSLLLEKKYPEAINTLSKADSIAETKEDKIKTRQIASEVYLSQGLYSSATEILKQAVDMDPENDLLRASYRSVNRLMIDKIESSLNRGWSQLKSAISTYSSKENKEDNKERVRVLKNLAMPDADAVIKVKEDLPDGYFLKGSIYYCLGEFNSAKKYLEKALSKTSLDDITFKTEVAQILGLAKVGNSKTMSLSSYLKMGPGNTRSLYLRESSISGILDTMG